MVSYWKEYCFAPIECRTVAWMKASRFSKALSYELKTTVVATRAHGNVYIETAATPRRVIEQMLV